MLTGGHGLFLGPDSGQAELTLTHFSSTHTSGGALYKLVWPLAKCHSCAFYFRPANTFALQRTEMLV